MPPDKKESDTRRENRQKSNEIAHAGQRYANAVTDEIHALRRLKELNAYAKPDELVMIRDELFKQMEHANTPTNRTERESTAIGQNAKTIFHTQSYEFEWIEKEETVKPTILSIAAQHYVLEVKATKCAIKELAEKSQEAVTYLHVLQQISTLDAVMVGVESTDLIAIREEILRQIG